MRESLWFLAAVLIGTVAVVHAARGRVRASLWLLIGDLGLMVCCVCQGMLNLSRPPLGDALWTRMLWCTGALTAPALVAFTQRFGRPEGNRSGELQRFLLPVLWLAAVALLVGGLIYPPLLANRSASGDLMLTLAPPMGRWMIVHALVATTLVLWNLHGTLEASQRSGRRRITLAIYAVVPLVIVSLYLGARLLLYGQLSYLPATDILLAAALFSTIAFGLAVGRQTLDHLVVPIERPVALSSVVLTALGIFFFGLAILSEFRRWVGVDEESGFYEGTLITLLVVVLSLWIFTGLREEIGRFLGRKLAFSHTEDEEAWERIRLAVASAVGVRDLAVALRVLLRDRFGAIRMQLWVYESLSGDYSPAEPSRLPRLGPRHPLVVEMNRRLSPFLLAGPALRLEEIPLHTACEDLDQVHGLRVFFPVRIPDHLVGILGCGPSRGRALHPEDIGLLNGLAEHLGPRLVELMRHGSVSGSGRGMPSGGSDGLLEVELSGWLRSIEEKVRTRFPELPRLDLRISGPPMVALDPTLLEPTVFYLLAGAFDTAEGASGQHRLEVRVAPDGRIEFDVDEGRINLSLRLTRTVPTV